MSAGYGSIMRAGQAIGQFFLNQASSAINSSRQWKYTRRAMEYQDQLNRAFNQWSLENNPSFSRKGYVDAGYNPLLALGSQITSQTGPTGPSASLSDSDQGTEAINSAMDAKRLKNESDTTDATVKKIDEERKGIELDNRLKKKQLNTDPKAVVSDLLEGNDTPVTKIIKKIGQKVGVGTGEINSAISSNNYVPKVIKLHDGKPYLGNGKTKQKIPKSVISKFDKLEHSAVSSKKKDENIGIWNSKQTVRGYYLSDDEEKRLLNTHKTYSKSRNYNRPPKSIPY